MPALPLTPEQKEDAARLKNLFRAWQTQKRAQGESATQDSFGDLVGFGQSAVNQYLNGKIPLNPHAAAKFSKALSCQISDFSLSIAAVASEIGSSAAPIETDEAAAPPMDITDLSKLEVQLVLMFRELPNSAKDDVISLTNRLHNIAKPKRSAANPYPNAPLPAAGPTPQPKAKSKRIEGAEH